MSPSLVRVCCNVCVGGVSSVNVGNATVCVGSVRISLGRWECVSECVSTGGRRIDTECTMCVFTVCIYCVCMYMFSFYICACHEWEMLAYMCSSVGGCEYAPCEADAC